MLNKPLQIRNMTIKNRFAVPPMVCFCWSDDNGYMTEKHIEHYKAMAEGGFGLIIVEATAVEKRGRLHGTELGLWEDGQIEGFKRLANAIHEGGSKALVQLVYAGGNGIDPDAKAPSAMDYRPGIKGHEMTQTEIDETIASYVAAALRAKEAGFDGVELHGCHGYLISCFFNSRKNKRTDAYGTDRSLFAKEALSAVRAACGSDFVVGIRLGAFEPTMEDAIEHAKAIAEYTDFLDVAYGGDSDPYAPEDFPCSAAVYGAMNIKKELPDMPVFGVHMIYTKESVLEAMNTGIDMVDAGRASLVDPAFANHILNDEPYGKCMQCKGYCRWNPPSMADPNAKCPGAIAYAASKQ